MRKPLPISFVSLFNDLLFSPKSFEEAGKQFQTGDLPCNEYTDNGTYVLEIAAAGFSKEDISVKVDPNRTLYITIIDCSKPTTTKYQKDIITRKIAHIDFRMSKLFPQGYTLEAITCAFKDGLLIIRIPYEQKGFNYREISID